jgi:hypothetical protein
VNPRIGITTGMKYVNICERIPGKDVRENLSIRDTFAVKGL